MTAETLKQEAIRKTYGVYYDILKPDEDGVFKMPDERPNTKIMRFLQTECTFLYGMDMVHNSLIGLNENNGWFRILSEDDLPDEQGNYIAGELIDLEFKIYTYPFSKEKIKVWFNGGFITHYRPVTEIPKPIW